AKKIDVLKPQTCVPRNFLGIFRGNSEEPYKFIEIHAHDILFPRINENIPRKFRGTHSKTLNKGYISVIQTAKCCFRFKNPTSSEKPRNIPRKFRGKTSVPRNIPRLFRGSRALLLGFLFLRKSLGIFRGNSEEHLFFLGISSEYSEAFPRK
ncbi:hypothetical protein IGI04_014315, partial [Brassica rapa subsp. trilocularis]